MYKIAGFFHPEGVYLNNRAYFQERLNAMGDSLKKNGKGQIRLWLSSCICLSETGPSEPETASSLISKAFGSGIVAVAFCGELYNSNELRTELKHLGHSFQSSSDKEILLESYLEWGMDFVKRLNGIFAFAICDTACQTLLLFRDRIGSKPLFYTVLKDGELAFSSRIRSLLSLPEIKPKLDLTGANEIFSLGPARSSGCGIFCGIREVLPGHVLILTPERKTEKPYWTLESHPHGDSWEKTVEKTSFLVTDAISRQLDSAEPVCTFLSGGLDSSLVSAVCARKCAAVGKTLTTFSFDFTENDACFQSNDFQPSRDRPYAEQMVRCLHTDHHYLECSSTVLASRLTDSVLAHDLPAMGDIDASLLHFCSMVKNTSSVALTGECADEIFGGYPWFYKEDCLKFHGFPWTMDLSPRKALLKDEIIKLLHMEEYVQSACDFSLSHLPVCKEDTKKEARQREIVWLNLNWFMRTLLERMDRAADFSGLKARVPFADHRIIEYLWNVPWELKAKDHTAKGLLRHVSKGLLPEEVLWRKKSPYPKTYDTHYEALLAEQVREIIHDPSSPVMEFLDREKTERFLQMTSDYGKPWYGQLMAGPQMMAYLIQINFWLSHYRITLKL